MVLAAVMVVACPVHPAWAQIPVPREPFGEWTLGNAAPGNMLATHATLLRNNKILVVSGSSYNCCAGSQGCPGSNVSWGKEETRLYDIASGSWGAKMTSPAPYGSDKDAFCSGHSHDDGNGVIFQGGLRGYCGNNGHGIANTARYDLTTGCGRSSAPPPLTGTRRWWPACATCSSFPAWTPTAVRASRSWPTAGRRGRPPGCRCGRWPPIRGSACCPTAATSSPRPRIRTGRTASTIPSPTRWCWPEPTSCRRARIRRTARPSSTTVTVGRDRGCCCPSCRARAGIGT